MSLIATESQVRSSKALLFCRSLDFCGAQNLGEITLFPMNQQAEDLLMGAPSEATAEKLRELHIRLNLPKKE